MHCGYCGDEDVKIQTKSKTDGGNEFKLSDCLSFDWMIILAVSPSWKWPPLTGSSWRDKQEHKQPPSMGVCVCVCAACICLCILFRLLLFVSAGAAEMRIGAPAYSDGNLIWCDCKGRQTAVKCSPTSYCRYTHYNSKSGGVYAGRKIMLKPLSVDVGLFLLLGFILSEGFLIPE